MNKSLLVSVCKYGLGLGLLAWVIWKNWEPPGGIGLKSALEHQPQWLPLILAGVLCTGAIMLTFVRWYVLVRAQDLPFTLPNAFRLGLVGFFLSTFLPGSIGGDIIKAAFLAREQSRRTVAVATVMVDRGVGLWGLFWLVAILGSVFWLSGNPVVVHSSYLQSVIVSAVALVVATVACWLLLGILPNRRAERFAGRLLRLPKVGHSLSEFWRAIWMYRRQRSAIFRSLLLSLVAHVGFVLTFYFSAQVFLSPGMKDEIPTLEEHFLIVPIGMVVQAVFPSPGGVGGGEAFFALMYEQLGRARALGALGCLAQRMLFWALGLIGYLVYLQMRPAIRSVTENQTVVEEELATA